MGSRRIYPKGWGQTRVPEALPKVWRNEKPTPECCRTCGHYMPQGIAVIGSVCSAFGTTDGVKDNRCGLHTNAYINQSLFD